MPVRRGAVPGDRRFGRRIDLPLPHVPEGVRRFYAPLVSQGDATLEWTRGVPQRFASSNHAKRLFCGKCGTPLGYDAPDGIGLAIGAFDNPASIVPERQWGTEAKLPYIAALDTLPSSRTEEDMASAPFLATVVSFQHPDHDTENWPETRP